MGGKQCVPQKKKGKTTGGIRGQIFKPSTQQVPIAIEGAAAEAPKPQRSRTKKIRSEPTASGPSTEGPMELEPLE